MRSERFQTPGRLTVDVALGSADLVVTTWEQDVTEVDVVGDGDGEAARAAELEVAISHQPGASGGVLLLREGKSSSGRRWGLRLRDSRLTIRVRCPGSTELKVTGGSSDVFVEGLVRAVDLKVGSGDVNVAGPVLERARVVSASGDVSVDAAEGSLSVTTASGDVRIGRVAGELGANSVSGDVEVREAHARATVQSVSGDVELTSLGGGDLRVQTVSGDIEVGLARGVGAWIDAGSVSGDIESELEVGDTDEGNGPVVELRVKSVSGDIRLLRAATSIA